ncbi:MAG: thiamine-phosphate kinase [Actinobacteria bacterium]|nr:thiamine-phosphate kinase [Actinomycetota bacterium]
MRVSDAGEFGLIAILRGMLGEGAGDLLRGVGDDAAVIRGPGGALWAYTADALVEGVHFDLSYTSWHSLGYRALAANLSDLASMGGCGSSYALVVLGLREEVETESVEEMYRGMLECGDAFACRLAGGDIVRSAGGLFVSISLVGSLEGGRYLARGNARPGELVLVTGSLGDSSIGLEWLRRGGEAGHPCAARHLYPRPRLEEGRLAMRMGATAAIDVSDGLLRDLGHICEESGVGAEVYLEEIPVSREARELARELGTDHLGAALHGGEDYELVITAGDESAREMAERLPASIIGRVTEGGGVTVLDGEGRRVEVSRLGYEHFGRG